MDYKTGAVPDTDKWVREMKDLHLDTMRHLGDALTAVRKTLDGLDNIREALSRMGDKIYENKPN